MHKFIKVLVISIITFFLCGTNFTASSRAQNVPQTPVGYTERVSVASDGAEGNLASHSSSISANGRYVAFASEASNLVPGDTNNYCETDGDGTPDDNCMDVFVKDRLTGETTRVSVASIGIEGNNSSGDPAISADGRFVAFISMASNLVAEDSNSYDQDIFVHDRQTGETSLVSVSSTGIQQYVWSYSPAISADGRYVAFQSDHLVEWDINYFDDVFVHDRQTGETTLVSVSSSGEQGNNDSGYMISISGDGRYVAFNSNASNLVGEPYIYNNIVYS
jgi:hypothetical protein